MKYSDYIKRTAWEVHELATKREEIYQLFSDDPVVQRKPPTIEQAKAFVEIANKQKEYLLSLCYGGRRFTHEEGDEIIRQYDQFEEMALDMRNVVFEENEKQVLQVNCLFLLSLTVSRNVMIIFLRLNRKFKCYSQFL